MKFTWTSSVSHFLRRLRAGVVLAVSAFILASCGSGSTTTPPPGGGGPNPFNPPVVVPSVESYRNLAPAGASAAQRWRINSYGTIPAAGRPYQNSSLTRWADMIYARINAERQAAGRAELLPQLKLERLAQAHARDMALRNYFSHITPEGLSAPDRLNALNPPAYSYVGETNAAGQETVNQLISRWLDSASHRSILLNEQASHFGVGVYFDTAEGSDQLRFSVMVVGFNSDPSGW